MLVAGCGGDGDGDGDSIATVESSPGTLGQLDDVVITVAQDELSGDRVLLEDTDDDGEVEISSGEDFEVADDLDGDSQATVTETEASGGEGGDDNGVNPFGGDDPEDQLMPDVVCMGLQDAQNEIQDRGVFFSKSVDATGDGRRQLFDRNWIVVSQEPAAGEPIGENEAVLSVVKTDEDNDC